MILAIIDGGGVMGYVLYYSLLFAMLGSTSLVFVHLWRKGLLAFDESAKYTMFESDPPRESKR